MNSSGVTATRRKVPSMTESSSVEPSGRRRNQSPNFDIKTGANGPVTRCDHGAIQARASSGEMCWMRRSSHVSFMLFGRALQSLSEAHQEEKQQGRPGEDGHRHEVPTSNAGTEHLIIGTQF